MAFQLLQASPKYFGIVLLRQNCVEELSNFTYLVFAGMAELRYLGSACLDLSL